MDRTTFLALFATILMTGATFAADRPEIRGTTTDELTKRPERPERSEIRKSEIERPEVPGDIKKEASRKVVNIRAELDRIKQALKRLRENNSDLTDEQIQRIKERLRERAKAVVARAKSSTAERAEDLKPRLGNRDELLNQARENRDQRRSAAQAATGRSRE